MRILDDKIVYALNTSIPTESFANKVDAPAACQDLYTQIQKGHSERDNVIKNCIVATAEIVKKLKAEKDEKPNDFEVMKQLKAEQKKVLTIFCGGKIIHAFSNFQALSNSLINIILFENNMYMPIFLMPSKSSFYL